MRTAGTAPLVVGVRPAYAQRKGRIPGAITISMEEINNIDIDLPDNTEIIVYCACPNEASAARVAKQLMKKGYARVRPLQGGLDAWVATGQTLES